MERLIADARSIVCNTISSEVIRNQFLDVYDIVTDKNSFYSLSIIKNDEGTKFFKLASNNKSMSEVEIFINNNGLASIEYVDRHDLLEKNVRIVYSLLQERESYKEDYSIYKKTSKCSIKECFVFDADGNNISYEEFIVSDKSTNKASMNFVNNRVLMANEVWNKDMNNNGSSKYSVSDVSGKMKNLKDANLNFQSIGYDEYCSLISYSGISHNKIYVK